MNAEDFINRFLTLLKSHQTSVNTLAVSDTLRDIVFHISPNIINRESEMLTRVMSLVPEIDETGTDDILMKLYSILFIIPNANLSIIDHEYNLIAVSSSQAIDWFDGKQPQRGVKCYEAYNRFEKECNWCVATNCIKDNEVYEAIDIISPLPPKKFNNSIHEVGVSDITTIPCGKLLENGRVTHCIEIIFTATKREAKRVEKQIRRHKFLSFLFNTMNKSIVPQTIHKLFAVGTLYLTCDIPDINILKTIAKIYVLYNNTFGNEKYYTISIKSTEKNNSLWEEFLTTGSIKPLYKMELGFEFEKMPIQIISKKELLEIGSVIHFDECRKACVYVKGVQGDDELFDMLFLIDKSQIEYFVTPEEKVFLSNYALMCQFFLTKVQDQEERIQMAIEYNKICELSDPSKRDAYLAARIIGLAHNMAIQYNHLMSALDALKGIIPDNIVQRKMYKEIANTLDEAHQNLSINLNSLNKWRKIGATILRNVDIVESINNVLSAFGDKIKDIDIKWEKENNTSYFAKADSDYFEEVIVNLLSNACDALEGRENKKITIKIAHTTNNKIKICIEDNGIGIEAQNRQKIWQPYFTTKGLTKGGSGLGLPFVKFAVESAFQGQVGCYSEQSEQKYRTTGFVIYLNKAGD